MTEKEYLGALYKCKSSVDWLMIFNELTDTEFFTPEDMAYLEKLNSRICKPIFKAEKEFEQSLLRENRDESDAGIVCGELKDNMYRLSQRDRERILKHLGRDKKV